MQVVVITNEALKEELISGGIKDGIEITWQEQLTVSQHKPDAVIDLLFQNDPARIEALKQMTEGIIIINSVAHTLSETDPSFIRINGWPTLLKSASVEAACRDESNKSETEKILAHFSKTPCWLPDEPGFITPRVISMIINEAFLSLEEGVSTKEHINTAMKLGTNYPYGPFEWSEKLGTKNICELLQKLATSNPRYTPASALAASIEKNKR